MSERTHIPFEGIRVGDTVEREIEKRGVISAQRLTVAKTENGRNGVWAVQNELGGSLRDWPDAHWYLLDRPEPDLSHLPSEPTMGWAIVGERTVPGTDWHVYTFESTAGPRTSLLTREVDVEIEQVKGFIEGVLVPKSLLDDLRDARRRIPRGTILSQTEIAARALLEGLEP